MEIHTLAVIGEGMSQASEGWIHPLRLWRHAHGRSQGQLGKLAGVHAKTIARIESPRKSMIPRGEILTRLLRATHLPTDAFVRPREFLEEHPEFLASLPPPRPIQGPGRPRKRSEENHW